MYSGQVKVKVKPLVTKELTEAHANFSILTHQPTTASQICCKSLLTHRPKHCEHDQNLSTLKQFLKDHVHVFVVCGHNTHMS